MVIQSYHQAEVEPVKKVQYERILVQNTHSGVNTNTLCKLHG